MCTPRHNLKLSVFRHAVATHPRWSLHGPGRVGSSLCMGLQRCQSGDRHMLVPPHVAVGLCNVSQRFYAAASHADLLRSGSFTLYLSPCCAAWVWGWRVSTRGCVTNRSHWCVRPCFVGTLHGSLVYVRCTAAVCNAPTMCSGCPVARIACGEEHSTAVTFVGEVYVWG